jgi:type 2A phosphatase activator TIP41
MASNGQLSDTQGADTIVSRNKQWKISTRKRPILKAGPIDAMNEKLGIPVPEMIFGDNLVAIEHVPSGWAIKFNSFDALDRVSKTADGMLQVAYSKEWQKDRYVLRDLCNSVKSTNTDLVRFLQPTPP